MDYLNDLLFVLTEARNVRFIVKVPLSHVKRNVGKRVNSQEVE